MSDKKLSFLTRTISPSGKKSTYNVSIEQYRGVCAILVMLNHATAQEYILIDNFHWPEFIQYINSSYLAVLMFFCISGYAIGVSTHKDSFEIGTYLKRRAIRLYPIYIISLILCVMAADLLPLSQILYNLFFLQNTLPYINHTIPIFINFPSWSLNYEVLYYLAFIPIILVKPRLWVLAIIIIIPSILLIGAPAPFVFIANYINGFYFWLLGLFAGWNLIPGNPEPKRNINLLSLIFLQLCQNYLHLGQIVMSLIGIKSATNFHWLFDLPFCFLVLCKLAGLNTGISKINAIFCYSAPGFIFLFLAANGRLLENERWIMCSIFWAISLLLINENKVSQKIAARMTFIGSISYGIYLFHVPVAILIHKYLVIGNQFVEVVIKYSLWFASTFIIAYFAEKVIQPRLKLMFVKSE